jgi:glucose-1-phosphate thymidylyltransferase
MKGVILAGGTGTRLFPSTKVTNKHLIPVFDRPMIMFPIQTLKDSGIREILIITNSNNAGDFLRLLGSGQEYGVNLTYKIQDGSGGIAQALSLAEDFAHDENIAVILGDNIFESDFADDVLNFKSGARIFIKHVDDPERFGVVEVGETGMVQSIEEKPSLPKSSFAQTGFFLYDNEVFEYIHNLSPSERGELEITDVNKIYLNETKLTASRVDGMWIDAGTHDSLLEASILAQEAFDPEKIKERQSQKARLKSIRNTKLVTAGLVLNNSEKYIIPALESLQNQDYENLKITVFDNNSQDDSLKIIREKFPEIKIIESAKNVGFAKGHNSILKECENDFYACLNIDMMFAPNFISELVKSIEDKPVYGAAGGKIKFWDFSVYEKGSSSQGKTNFIDTVGVRILKSHRFEDIGQGEMDYGQFDKSREIFGVSGSAVLYRRKSLEDVSFINELEEKEYFDESMFMYKEDVDLAYRLQWAGWKTNYNPMATAYHDRTVSFRGKTALEIIKNRIKKPKSVNRQSYLNHRVLLQKNFSNTFSSEIKSATSLYNLKVFVYILIFETELLGAWWNIFKMRGRIQKWRKKMPRRVTEKEIERLMHE